MAREKRRERERNRRGEEQRMKGGKERQERREGWKAVEGAGRGRREGKICPQRSFLKFGAYGEPLSVLFRACMRRSP